MTEEQAPYIDPNSGAAPQPGGYAGAHAFADGHGSVPPGYSLADDGHVEPTPAPEVDEEDGELEEFTQQEASEAKSLETQATNSEQGEGEGAEAIPGNDPEGELDDFTDKEASDAKALELQGLQIPEPENADLGGGEKDYSDLLSGGVKDIQKYLDENPAERDAVVAAERERAAAAEKDPRKGIVGDD